MTNRKTAPSATALIAAALLLLGANAPAGAAPGKGNKNQMAAQKKLHGASTNLIAPPGGAGSLPAPIGPCPRRELCPIRPGNKPAGAR
jgi:hypothetical protein